MNEDTVGGSVPAFPVAIEKEDSNGVKWTEHESGLTKRELFAAMAMQGLLANISDLYRNGWKGCEVEQFACERADGLLKELEK
jgi:hypothetical protein